MMLRTILLAFLLYFPSSAFAADPAPAQIVGKLIEVEGSATQTAREGSSAAAKTDNPVNLGDTLETSEKAKLLLVLVDGTEIILGGNGKLTVDEYVYAPAQEKEADNKARYSILRGAFLYTSGLIGKAKAHNTQVETAYGTIGIRGTQFWGGEIDDAYGVLVNEGEIQFATDEGRVLLNKGMGVMLKDKKDPPGAIKRWSDSKIKRATAMITLKHADKITEKVKAYKVLQMPPEPDKKPE